MRTLRRTAVWSGFPHLLSFGTFSAYNSANGLWNHQGVSDLLHSIRYLFIVFVGTLTAACHVCAPPIRSANNGAPGKLREGDLEIGTAANLVLAEDYLETPGIHAGGGYAINDRIAVEAGADTVVTNSVIGNVGVRIAPFPIDKQSGRVKLLFDVVLGGGLGVGGRQATTSDHDELIGGTDSRAGAISARPSG
jgi:hypothetical protein